MVEPILRHLGVCGIVERRLANARTLVLHHPILWPIGAGGGNLQTSIHLWGTLTLLLFLPVFRCLGHSYCLHPRSEVYELCASWLEDRDRGITASRLTFFGGE